MKVEEQKVRTSRLFADNQLELEVLIEKSWKKIAPFWPLKNLIAVNPLLGFEEMKFEEALEEANIYFRQNDLPSEMEKINRESIKWLMPLLDQGQATLKAPNQENSFFKSFFSLLKYDLNIIPSHSQAYGFFKNLREEPLEVIEDCVSYLNLNHLEIEEFFSLLLTTLPGWAAHVQYLVDWSEKKPSLFISKEEYLAFRLVLTALIWPESKKLLSWAQTKRGNNYLSSLFKVIQQNEETFEKKLADQLKSAQAIDSTKKDAQLVFCIDVRSERIRKAIELQGAYETFGFAGFFGIPLEFSQTDKKESFPSCPVLLKPKTKLQIERIDGSFSKKIGLFFKKIYKTLKYNFASPFALAESMGFSAMIWMIIRNLFPNLAFSAQRKFNPYCENFSVVKESINHLSEAEKVSYAENALKIMRLTKDLSDLVIFCGHGSTTENNAFASALDCGACGGRKGGLNAQVLAHLLNDEIARKGLKTKNIFIPDSTHFVGGIHDTTTDEIEIFDSHLPNQMIEKMNRLKIDLKNATLLNCEVRNKKLLNNSTGSPQNLAIKRAHDWAEVRPEWGLAKNGAFIIGPRSITKNINLDGEAFLHSYDYKIDKDDVYLETILTAPVIVAEWINLQYLFSTLDNVAFGAGSKITKNVTGKIGVMQGNGSDLMNGLPLQSIAISDKENYHELRRLQVVVYAPSEKISKIIQRQNILKKLFGNQWLQMICIEPETNQIFKLCKNFTWSKI